MLQAMENGAKSMGVAVRDAPCHDDTAIEAVMATLAQGGAGGLLALGDVFNQVHREAIVALALKYKVPTVVNTRQITESGGLMSYALDISDLFRRSTDYVDRILKGEKPADLPVQATIVRCLRQARSRNAIYGFQVASNRLLRLDVGRADDLSPFTGFVGNQFPKVSW